MLDIKQTFLNVVIPDEDRDYLHFFLRQSIFNQTKHYYFTFFPRSVYICYSAVLLAYHIC